jgi:hypothetical protein
MHFSSTSSTTTRSKRSSKSSHHHCCEPLVPVLHIGHCNVLLLWGYEMAAAAQHQQPLNPKTAAEVLLPSHLDITMD